MTPSRKKLNPDTTPPSATAAFFAALEERTSDVAHLRLLKAARGSDPSLSLEQEFGRIIEELLHET